jgi:pimeloyl-ACP methyl ester carboxylesterase
VQIATNPHVVPTDLRALHTNQPRAIPAPAANANDLTYAQIALVKRALNFCLLSYGREPKVVKETLEENGYTNVRALDHRCMQGICFTDREFAYLAFRGSESFGDWAYNFAALPCFRPLRHLGFELGWRCLRSEVTLWLDALDLPNAPLVLTGHSLGGAIAHLAAFDLARQGRRISNVVTFGAPKAAFLSTARLYNATRANMGEETLGALTFCIVNQLDLVPRVPPKLIGFRTVGCGIVIDQENHLNVGVGIDSILFDLLRDVADVAQHPSAIAVPATLRQFLPKLPRALKEEAEVSSALGKQLLEIYFNWARVIPPLLLPLMYVRAVFDIGSSGVNHLSGQYVRTFFGSTQPPIYYKPENRWLGQVLKCLILLLLLLAVLAGFCWTCWVALKGLKR